MRVGLYRDLAVGADRGGSEIWSHPERFADRGDAMAAINDVACDLQPLIDLYDASPEGEMNFPPDYPKMPGEPPRVQPSKKVAAHWDEATGDMICRAVVGWGGRGVRGDTDRIGTKLLAGILSNVLASQYAMGLTAVERPMPAAGRGGLVCAHCGFASAHERAFYCPKCGMRLLRG